MQIRVCCFVLLLTIHAADAFGKISALWQPDENSRILQGFGVVDSPAPLSKPTLPPIFAPVKPKPSLPPIFAPIAAPVKPRPISIPVPTVIKKPVSAPRVAPSSGFGSSGGGGLTATVTPTVSTESPTSSSSALEGPTSIPTTGAGVVLLDEPTGAPTISPVIVLQSSPPVAASWLSFVVTFTSEMYTIVKDPVNVQEILRTVHGDIRKSLHHLIKLQNASIIISLLESELIGTCPGSVNITNPDELTFPNFPICNNVKARIITKMDDTKISEETVRDSFITYISDSFIPEYNTNSSIARLRYMEPINVSATLNITLVGVSTEMNTGESIVFEELVRTVFLGLFLNGTESNRITPMNMERVKILHQRSTSSDKELRFLQSSSGESDDPKRNDFAGKPTNKVEVLVETTCARHKTCTDYELQSFLNDFAPPYGAPLMTVLAANSEFFYFDDLRSVFIGEQIIPELPPAKPQNPLSEEEMVESEKTPVWIISLIVVICVVFTTTILYILVRRRVRKLQGDKLRDGIHKDRDDENSNILRNTPFTPTLAPSFQQIQEWSNGNTTQESYQQQQQQPQPQPRDTSIFHKRGQSKVQQPIREYEEEDDYYDDGRYDNDQFSVEAGNFGDNAYDENQWNSSFRSYT